MSGGDKWPSFGITVGQRCQRTRRHLCVAIALRHRTLFYPLILLCLLCVAYLYGRLSACVEFDGAVVSGRANYLSRLADRHFTGAYRDSHKLCVVVPFRDRFEELLIFAPHMQRFLVRQSFNYRILVINQIDTLRFNRAALINVGYLEARSIGCDYLCMHDVDLLPKNPSLSYAWPGDSAVHLASPEYHPRYNYTKFIGGILLLTMRDFLRVNGMSNKYWGWGLEDDEFFLRLRDAKPPVVIRRPENLTSDRSNTFLHLHDKRIRKRDTTRIGNQRKMSRKRDRLSGVTSVSYRVWSRTELSIDSAPVTVINVEVKCNRSWTPYCDAVGYEPPSSVIPHLQLSSNV